MFNSEHILLGIREGDHRVYELFYRMEFLNLVHFVNAYLQDQERSRDISQETLLALWENRALLTPGRNLRAFVFTIAKNKTLNELRSRKHLAPALQESLELLEDRSVEEYIEALDLNKLIAKVWDSFPENMRQTFLDRQEGLKNREIAAREGVSEKTVEYRLKAVRERFRAIFKKNDIGI